MDCRNHYESFYLSELVECGCNERSASGPALSKYISTVSVSNDSTWRSQVSKTERLT